MTGAHVENSIAAYDIPKRIASYDADMDVMHPNRHKMIDVALSLLPFDSNASVRALDVGIGTGFFTQQLLKRCPNTQVIAIDGAPNMVEVASERLGDNRSKVDFRVGDFQALDSLLDPKEKGQLVITSYALHHLPRGAKESVIRRCVEFLEPGGWFLNADIVLGATEDFEKKFQQLRAKGILERAAPDDPRFTDINRINKFIENLERTENDQPLTLQEDLEVLAATALSQTTVFWHEFREAVTGGVA